jgi:hypothetical protein
MIYLTKILMMNQMTMIMNIKIPKLDIKLRKYIIS